MKESRAAKRRRQKRNRLIASLLAAILAVTGAGLIWGRTLFAGAAEIRESAIEDDGQLRVWLKTLSGRTALGITLRGVYTLENNAGFRFQDNTEITLSTDGTTIYLGVGGLYADMGSALRLTRAQSDADEAGLYIHEADRNNLYEGDLSVSVEKGTLEAILEIDMEDYLAGVIAYEMSDSFPVEALKAQAVAARTYALRAKMNKPDGKYHVTDTTSDQVFYGRDARLSNVVKAIEETSGVVGVYKGKPAGCYFTASNGGYVATPGAIWGGGGDYNYIVAKEDPYDLENPSSMVKSATFSAHPAQDSDVAALLKEQLRDTLYGMDYVGDAEYITIDEITSFTLTDQIDDGRYETAVFTVKVSACPFTYSAFDEPVEPEETPGFVPVETPGFVPAEEAFEETAPAQPEEEADIPAAEPAMIISDPVALAEPLTVTVEAYGAFREKLGLKLNGGKYEVFTVTEQNGEYTVETRRYGHGVGMSQRGAQQMAAKYEKSYDEILAFYYPGMELERIRWDTPELSSIEDLPDSAFSARAKPTPKPTQQPLPPVTGDEYYARVQLASAGSTLNVRKEPSTSAGIAGTLDHGDRVIVTGDAGDGWVSIKTVELTGYVKADYITTE